MKSQVNALLHVVQGIHKDIRAAYPELEDELAKDFGRLALYCQTRGIGIFTLDLPHLESLLLKGLESGRLELEGPLSERVSKRTHVPRLYSGLWLRVFDKSSCLKHEVDVTALFFLRQCLVVGKKLELGCSYDRTQSTVGAYHDIERVLRNPSLGWKYDNLLESTASGAGGSGGSERCSESIELFGNPDHCEHRDNCGVCSGCLGVLTGSFSKEEPGSSLEQSVDRVPDNPFLRLHLVQALDGSPNMMKASLPLFREELSEEEIHQRTSDQALLSRIQCVADLIIGSFDELDPIGFSAYLEEHGQGIGFRHGPGAVAERLKNWEKSKFPNWPHKLQSFFPYNYCGRTIGSEDRIPPNHEVASRLIAVPKTTKGPRLIAAEPTSHQWCQQLVLRFLFDQCRVHLGTHFIDFKDQSKSADLVLEASRDRSLATVDLSDASDRLTCWTVERMFRSNPSVLNALHAARTRYIRDEISDEVSFLSLRKFASQGTATTFPVMSLVMLCIALGASLDRDITWHRIRKLRTQVRVFGDDIIVPRHGYEQLLRAMELLQLKVNVAKSYVHGHFRESCGMDGYLGYDVTPVKPKTIVADSPASCQAVVDTSNNLYMKGLWHASAACYDLLPARLRRGIRIVGANDAGFRGLTSYSGSYESHLAKRWNSRLHRYEVRVWSLSLQSYKRPRDGWTAFLDFIARKHSHEHARTVSEYADIRKTRIGLHWEPLNTGARLLSTESGYTEYHRWSKRPR